MQCPACTEVTLVMTDRQGIEVDYCPHCRGIWLDRGELDKIIERATPASAQWTPENRGVRQPISGSQDYSLRRDDDDDDYRDDQRKKKKRGGFLGELFEFD